MKYDAIVIGSGQGGNPLSQKLADLGWRVALTEKEPLGGTCINTGCTPTKTMIASAQVAHYARSAARWGVQTGEVSVDLPQIVARKDKIVQSFRSGQQRKMDQRENLHLYRGHARFVAPHRIKVGEEELEGERTFINTGTRPEIPRLPGLDAVEYQTNGSIMELSEDPDVAGELQKALEAEGISFVLRARTNRVQKANGRIALTLDGDGGSQTVSGSHLLVATGRRPNTHELGLEKVGVETDARGFIKVNGRLETNAPGIWALGDVKGGPAFTHISYNDYQILYANLVEGKDLTIDHRIVPYSVFTDPQLGRVGLTEKEARARGHRLKIGKIPMTWVARAIERDETAGLMKLVVDAENDRILGAAIVATEGGELIQTLGVLILADLPYTPLKGAVYIHPTLAEGFYTLMEEVKPAE